MKLDVSVMINSRIKDAVESVRKAARMAMRDTVVEVQADAVEGSPWLTGNNRRSIKSEVSGMGTNEMVDPSKIEGAVYSTSGYGGYLETGTYKMAARPYFRPALDRHFTQDEFVKKMEGYVT